MTERTFNIIMACKHHSDNDENIYYAVKRYMSKECMCPENFYSEVQMAEIMRNAMYDYIDTCDKPNAFLRLFDRVYDREFISLSERIARAFTLVKVRDNRQGGKYINGFTAELMQKYEEENSIVVH